MSFSGQKPVTNKGRIAAEDTTLSEASSRTQLKRELGGLSYQEQRARLQPAGDPGGGLSVQMLPGSDAATLSTEDSLSTSEVSGPIGRLFNRICGVDENRTDTAGMFFGQEQLRAYLDVEIQMAEGEWFRGLKLDGIAKMLIEQLDVDGDGLLCWDEFKAFEGHILQHLAPEVAMDATTEETVAAARAHHGELAGADGELGYEPLREEAKSKVPEGTDNTPLIAQLAARIALDVFDRDERGKPVAERSLSEEEWTGGAREISERQDVTG